MDFFRKTKDKLKFIPTYLIGIIIWFYYKITVFFNVTRVYGLYKIPYEKSRIFLISNHPSLLEPQVLIGLFAPEYILHPKIYGPKIIADVKNYGEKWWSFAVDNQLVFVDRSGKTSNISVFGEIEKILKENGNVIGFLEGTRTWSDKPGERIFSKKGKAIRRLKSPLIGIACKTEAIILPVWCERGKGLHLDIYIGSPIRTKVQDKSLEITLQVEQVLLKLGDSAY